MIKKTIRCKCGEYIDVSDCENGQMILCVCGGIVRYDDREKPVQKELFEEVKK